MLYIDKTGLDYRVEFKEEKKLNINNAAQIKEMLLPLIMQEGNSITLDFNGIVFVDSSGFQVLVALLKAAEMYYSQFEIINISTELKELFDLLNLSDVFQIAAN